MNVVVLNVPLKRKFALYLVQILSKSRKLLVSYVNVNERGIRNIQDWDFISVFHTASTCGCFPRHPQLHVLVQNEVDSLKGKLLIQPNLQPIPPRQARVTREIVNRKATRYSFEKDMHGHFVVF